jgi:type I restriction enzyme S subunit
LSLEKIKTVTLADVSINNKGEYGIGASAVDYSDELYTYLRITDINDDGTLNKNDLKSVDDVDAKNYLLNENDVVFARTGNSTGKAYYYDKMDGELVYAGFLIKFSLDPSKINPKFMKYYVLSKDYKGWVNSMCTGSTRPNINAKMYGNMELILPPREQQDFLVNILGEIDNKIEINKRINKNLDDILDSIFKENFIKEFDNDNNDWKIKNIGELPLIITDYVANGSFASLKENVTILDYEEYAYFIRNTDLKSKSFQKFVNKHSYDFLKKSSLFGNEVIISNVGDVGSVFLCPFLDKPMTLGNNMILVKSRDDAINLNFYLFLLFRSNYGQYLISTITAGSVQSKFNKTEFKSLELTMPNDELIIKFNNLVSPIFDYKNKISDEIVRLTKLRDTLLPKLMSGEIDVSKINCDLELKYNYMKYLFNQIHTPMSKSVV